jgi:peptidoglycan/LPS O-acetylase OafA/YrhL
MRPGNRAERRLPSLDGLRAISIFFVFLGHLNGTRNFGVLSGLRMMGDLAHLGVVVFFVISGFLITSLLLQEYEKTGRISLHLFYARRALRIFPASFAYLGILYLSSLAGLIQLHANDLAHAMTYTVNYSTHRSWYIGHLWSLSVEEQFYLLWPFAFWRLGPRQSRWVLAAVIALAPCARAAAALFLHAPYRDLAMFPMVADSLAAGCLLAYRRDWLEGQAFYLRLFRPVNSLVLLTAILAVNRYLGHSAVNVLGMLFINLGIAVLIHRSVYLPDAAAGRFLNWKPVAFVGTISYSLYLWQQWFLNRYSAQWTAAFPQNLGLAAGAAMLSYFLLEKPLMSLRHRLRAD